MAAITLSCRAVLAAVFLVAGAGKLLDLSGSRAAVEGFGVPAKVARLAGPTLPIVEIVVAVLLVPKLTALAGAIGALALLLVFAAGIIRAISLGTAPDCHCFGQIHSEPAGASTLVRNTLLAALAVEALADGGGRSFAAVWNRFTGNEVALFVAAVLVAVLALVSVQLWSDRRRIAAELEQALKARLPPGLAQGALAPHFELELVRGDAGSLVELTRAGRPTVLVFASTTCGPCIQMLPMLAQWQDSISHSVTIAALISGERVDIERLCAEHDLRLALAQEANEVFKRYALRVTPSAVLIDREGLIGGAPAEGVPAIEALIRSALATGSGHLFDVIPAS